MRTSSTLVLLAGAAGLAIAQSTVGVAASASTPAVSPSGCGTSIDLIISNCLSSTQALLSACAVNDWSCMCTQIGNVLTCYNNCPSDPARYSVVAQQTAWCNAAKLDPSSLSSYASASAGASSSTAAVATTASVSSTDSSAASSTDTSSDSASETPEASTGAGVATVARPGIALAAVLGLAALLL